LKAENPFDMTASAQRVLVTGLNGFTGLHLSESLARAGYEVHGTIRADEMPDETHHVADLADIEQLRSVFMRVRPRHVVHLAAVSFVGHGDVEEIYRTNIVGTSNLLRALLASNSDAQQLKTVLLASSANIYGNADVDPISEDQPPSPANDYAVSKAAMEQMAALWSKSLPITIVRPFNYTGVGQSQQFLLPKIIDAFARKASVLELGNVDVERDFADVRDVVDAYCRLLEASPRSTLNVCSEQAHSLREILATTRELSGHALEIKINPDFVRANEVKRLCGSAMRLRNFLPTWTTRPIRETLSWMLEERTNYHSRSLKS
jgi:GDP-6-deoxy-D-talose 4-dehydrogenase